MTVRGKIKAFDEIQAVGPTETKAGGIDLKPARPPGFHLAAIHGVGATSLSELGPHIFEIGE